jgi:hypothetical protein
MAMPECPIEAMAKAKGPSIIKIYVSACMLNIRP